MTRLSSQTLPDKVRVFSYDRDAVDIGIVHFGVGNFHRAHQAVYVEELLERGETQWGIAGVSLRSSTMRDALAPQDYLYTLAILGEREDYRIIGAVKDILVAPEDPQGVIDRIANPATQLVSSTITEKGYCLASGSVDFDHAALKAELGSLDAPTTIYGFLAQGLIQRFQRSPTSKLTIMCCDNISGGGEYLAQGVHALLGQHHQDALLWSQDNVSFISSMVDRVSPATDQTLIDTVALATGRQDAAPVSAEPFSQWVIEDNFAGVRPDFDRVGADIVDDIEPFERMKLGYLNAAHTLVSTLGYLSGDEYVHEALERPDIFKFMRGALYEDVLPFAPVPAGYDAASYIESVIERFRNANLPYANLQVGTDSSQKIQQRWFPTIEAALAQGASGASFAFCLAAWAVFIETALKNGVLRDPRKAEFEQVTQMDIGDKLRQYLIISNAERFSFFKNSKFMSDVMDHVQDIKNKGIEKALQGFLKES